MILSLLKRIRSAQKGSSRHPSHRFIRCIRIIFAPTTQLDFDDLIKLTVELFEANPKVLEYYQEKFQYILVDEYQDTNRGQYLLVNALAEKHQNICVVGDDDQSIYSWRGADINNILDFEQDYKDTTVLRLVQNYRSTKNILEAAYYVISNNRKRKEKQIWTDNKKGNVITLHEATDDINEADYVLRQIRDWRGRGRKYGDCVIFYRINAQSRTFEECAAGRKYTVSDCGRHPIL